jgi:tetratricopeptide (TPR) repeat protein
MVPRQVAGVTAAALALVLAGAPAVRAEKDATRAETDATRVDKGVTRADKHATPPECDGLWLATRSLSEQGDRASGDEKLRLLQRAIRTGEEAVGRCPESAEAHFWLGASYGRFAEAKRGLTALRMVGRIRREMQTAVRLQPDYDGGDAFLALGRLDLSVPGLFGGNRKRGVGWLEEGLRVAPRNLDIRLALAEAYLHEGRRAEAIEQLRTIVDAPATGAPATGASAETRRRALALLREQEPRPGVPPAEPRSGRPPGLRLEAWAERRR